MQIKLENVGKEYSDGARDLRVLDNVTHTFPSGKSVAIVGRSGVGKSTLLHVIGGLDSVSRGSIWYNDVCVSSLSDNEVTDLRANTVGFVFQFHHLLPEFSAVENVAMPLLITSNPAKTAIGAAAELLCQFGLGERLNHLPGQLSGGEQQRVSLARALVGRPRVLLADEPTGNLDFRSAKEIQDLLLQVAKESATTLIIVTHSRELADSVDIVLEMAPGGSLKVIRG